MIFPAAPIAKIWLILLCRRRANCDFAELRKCNCLLRQTYVARRTNRARGAAQLCDRDRACRRLNCVVNYSFNLSTPLIATALEIDLVAGDPVWMPHPVRMIGAAISFGDRILHTGDQRRDLCNGAVVAIATITLAAFCTWMIIGIARNLGEPLGAIAAIVIAWTTLALRGLDDAARTVERALESNDELNARRALPALIGRDPDALDRSAIIRATVESVAENTSDGVIAPMLFLFVGGPVAAIAYKAINTLDSMIGYRDARYLYFGRRGKLHSRAADGDLHDRGGAIRNRSCRPGMGGLSRRCAQACESQRRVSRGRGRGSARHPTRRRCDLWRRNRAARVDGPCGSHSGGCGYRRGTRDDANRDRRGVLSAGARAAYAHQGAGMKSSHAKAIRSR